MIDVRDTVADWMKAKTSVSFRRRVARTRVQARGWNAGLRALPDFLVIGAQRCGTSSLYTYLGRHPRVIPSLRKEVEYLSTRFGEGEGWYRAHFPLRARLAASNLRGGRTQTFEATPDYLLDPRAPERAATLLPGAKIVVLVRDPVARAYSQYMHNRRLGQEPLTFLEALDQEDSRIEGELLRMSSDPDYDAKPLRRFGYVARGMYADQIKLWQAHYPAEQIQLIQTEAFFKDTSAIFGEILDFLGIPRWQPSHFGNYSVASPTGSSQGMVPAAREKLTETFKEPNRQLYDLVGRDLGWKS
jgi:hypothetical protein